MSIQSNINRMLSLTAMLSKMPGKTEEPKMAKSLSQNKKGQAFQHLQERQDVTRSSNNVIDTLNNETTSLGSFKDLNPKLQEKIISAMSGKKGE